MNHCRSIFFSRDTDSDMVSIKFWRGKFSRPATGYECIAHALAFDRGVGRMAPKENLEPRAFPAKRGSEERMEQVEFLGHLV